MSKIAVVFWSGTGNTEIMAQKITEGAKANGNEVDMITASDFSSSKVGEYDALALGCPSMGAEVLEEGEFQPMFDDIKGSLSGKKLALFGSYDWGDGEWMRTWQDECKAAGANLVADGLIANLTPDADAEAKCIELGKAL